MNWYYAENGESKGPVGQELFDRMVQEGIIRIDTLVWHEGLADWQPYGQARVAAFAAGTAAPAVAAPDAGARDHRCCECERTFPESDMVGFEGRWVCAACKPRFFQRIREGAVLPGEMVYAGFWIRFGAKFIDGLILGVVNLILQGVFFALSFAMGVHGSAGDNPFAMGMGPAAAFGIAGMAILILLQLGIPVVYNTLFIGRYGATPGKMACGLRVVTADGQKVTYMRAFGRHFGEWLSMLTCYIGYIIAAFDDEKRALHDHVCSTRVIRK